VRGDLYEPRVPRLFVPLATGLALGCLPGLAGVPVCPLVQLYDTNNAAVGQAEGEPLPLLPGDCLGAERHAMTASSWECGAVLPTKTGQP